MNNIISSSGGGSITQEDLDLKQDKLSAGTNITIDENNVNSSNSDITQSDLDLKQNTLTSTSNITTGTISSGKITGRDLAVLDFQTLYGTVIQASTLIYGTSTNVASEISGLYSTVSNKQTSLGANINIITGTISSANITGRTSTTITAPTITASSNLLYGSNNVGKKTSSIETCLNTKQATLTPSSNITTGTINSGNITAPTITASSDLLYGSNNVGTKILSIETTLNGKQNTLISGTNINIDENNIIFSTGGISQSQLD